MRISTQLYTVRNELANDVPGTLKQIASYGIEYVELGGLNRESVKDWKRYLDETGLKVSGAHYGLAEFETPDELFEVMNALDCKTIIMPWISSEHFASLDSLKAFTEPLIDAGTKCHEAGFDYLYHNHDFEIREIDGKAGLEHLMDIIPPHIMNFEVDVAWVRVGGKNEVEFINAHADRVKMLHLKDVDPSRTPQWTVAGDGLVDMDGCLEFAVKNGISFGAIELDESPGSPLDAVRASFEFFESKGFK
ncbi:MAG: sugar phosphate isomerase/epimerase [Armatimonadetes bacterium]|nr:sugar phosphate isomerase/epimerase [Armatimonadota bacterium]